MAKTTEKQQQIYNFIAEYISQNDIPPSVRDICAAVGLSSTASVYWHLKKLEQAVLLDSGEGKKRAIRLTGGRGVPILGTVRAGEPITAFEDIEGYLPYFGSCEDTFALRVKGDSMQGAGINEGDCVVVRRQSTAESGEIVVALLGDEATVKRLKLSGGNVTLMPENDAYQPIDGDGAVIIGKVIALVREYN